MCRARPIQHLGRDPGYVSGRKLRLASTAGRTAAGAVVALAAGKGDNQLQQDRQTLDKWINAVAVTAAVAPLLGLLGTVSGMIETFRMMTSFGSSDPEVISGGIAKALVTTELGLIVAIPALILNALLSRKARQYYTELENFALILSGDEGNTHQEYPDAQARDTDTELLGSGHPSGAS